MAYIYDLTDTWNAGGTTFNAIKMNVTDSASASASKLVTLQTNGTEHFSVTKGGQGYFSGNVGIGTASPGAKLHVVGGNIAVDADARKIGYITDGTAANTGYMIPYDGSGFLSLHSNFATAGIKFHTGTGNDERMRITSAGNVGIGTATPTLKLEVNGSIAVSGVGSAVTFDTTGAAQANYISTVDSFSLRMLCGRGATSSFTAGPGAATIETNTTEKMRVTSAGDVGIGTSTPGAKLDVNGTSNFSDNMTLSRTNTAGSLTGITITNAGTTSAYAGFTVTSGSVISQFFNDANGSAIVAGAMLRTVSAHPLVFGTDNTERMRIDSSGNVGIGTSSPVYKFVVSDGGAQGFEFQPSTGLMQVYNRTTGAYGPFLPYASLMRFFTGSSPSERMRIDASGNLLVGRTASGGGRLEVDGNYIRYGNSASYTNDEFLIQRVAAGMSLNTRQNVAMTFSTNDTERARIDSSGNLLVGTTTAVGLVNAVKNGGDIYYASQTASGGYCYTSSASNNGGIYYHMLFSESGTARGTITSNGSTVSYNTTSDYRLKDIDGPIANSGAYIDALKPVQGSWKADGSRFIGLLAHEAQEVSETQIATGEKDGEEMQAMDYSAPEIIANLIAEIQSLRARVAQLEGN